MRANGLRYWRGAGVDSAWSRKNSKPEKCLKMPQNPTRRVHALLGCVFMHKVFQGFACIYLQGQIISSLLRWNLNCLCPSENIFTFYWRIFHVSALNALEKNFRKRGQVMQFDGGAELRAPSRNASRSDFPHVPHSIMTTRPSLSSFDLASIATLQSLLEFLRHKD